MFMRFLIPLLLAAAPATADPYAVLAGDTVLAAAEVHALIDGQTLTYHDDGQSRYFVGGAYSYSYAGGATAYGVYDIGADGTVCVAFHNGRNRCDRFAWRDGGVVLLTQKGDRFPVRR
ncbi:hypothetical protein ACFQFQ_02925 [Sulfitobacter porphyrae]|jgi:hypothetical protein|uniref:Secreted protein n=2 Tax=Sulfitobacter TaxID=60136 RepID=A0ABW2AZA1_9RHOB|nr:hypothetical protein [Sulfitobacter sp. PR48]MCZ4258338.1 hypothetical protein [Sulfitobacter sp. G21635-S1]GLT08980.1 hypothetical protein GCM10007928_12120 [Sulfitobacter porphyrae]